MKHLERNKILTSLNHNFRSGYSTESQLLVTTHYLLKSSDVKQQVDIAILDILIAFDTVHLDRSTQDATYGVMGQSNIWLSSFMKAK